MKILKLLIILSILFITALSYSKYDETPSSKAREEAAEDFFDALLDYPNKASSSGDAEECFCFKNVLARNYEYFRDNNELFIDLEFGGGAAYTMDSDRNYKQGFFPLVGVNINYFVFSYMFNYRYINHDVKDSDDSVKLHVLSQYIGVEFAGIAGIYLMYNYFRYNFDTLHQNKNFGGAFQFAYPILSNKVFSSRIFIRYCISVRDDDYKIIDKSFEKSYFEGGIKVGLGFF